MAGAPDQEAFEKAFNDEVESLILKYGRKISILYRRYVPQGDHCQFKYAYIAELASDKDAIRQELLQAFGDGFRFIESIGFSGDNVLFTPMVW